MTNEASSNYPIDAENVAEMARLTRQARLISRLTDLLPTVFTPSHQEYVLDLACGPGEWAITLAERYPGVEVMGIDISRTMTGYARELAHERRLANAHFRDMDVLKPLAFPDEIFDLIHARFLASFLAPNAWPGILRECLRVLKPGGIFISVETEWVGVTTGPRLTIANRRNMQVWQKFGRTFTREGDYSGIVAVQGKLLTEAGFADVHREAFPLDYSYASEAHAEMIQNFEVLHHLAEPAMAGAHGIPLEEYRVNGARALEDMRQPDFCAVQFIQRVWGHKPIPKRHTVNQ